MLTRSSGLALERCRVPAECSQVLSGSHMQRGLLPPAQVLTLDRSEGNLQRLCFRPIGGPTECSRRQPYLPVRLGLVRQCVPCTLFENASIHAADRLYQALSTAWPINGRLVLFGRPAGY